MGLLGHHKDADAGVQFNLKPLTLAVSRTSRSAPLCLGVTLEQR